MDSLQLYNASVVAAIVDDSLRIHWQEREYFFLVMHTTDTVLFPTEFCLRRLCSAAECEEERCYGSSSCLRRLCLPGTTEAPPSPSHLYSQQFPFISEHSNARSLPKPDPSSLILTETVSVCFFFSFSPSPSLSPPSFSVSTSPFPPLSLYITPCPSVLISPSLSAVECLIDLQTCLGNQTDRLRFPDLQDSI